MSFTYQPGDSNYDMLHKLLNRQLGAWVFSPGDPETQLVRKIAWNAGATPHPTDGLRDLYKHWLSRLAGRTFHPSDSVNDVLRKILFNHPLAPRYAPGDSDNDILRKLLSAPTGIAPVITSGVPPAGTAGVLYSFTVVAAGTGPLTFSATGLPTGLSIDPVTGIISGTPTTGGSFPTVITVSNGVLPDDTEPYLIVIAPADAILTEAGDEIDTV